MKWLQNTFGIGSDSRPKPSEAEPALSAADSSSASVQAIEDEAEHTEKWSVPDEIDGEPTPALKAELNGRSPSGRRLARTVASPIPAMLAESMGLAEEPAADPQVNAAQTANLRGR